MKTIVILSYDKSEIQDLIAVIKVRFTVTAIEKGEKSVKMTINNGYEYIALVYFTFGIDIQIGLWATGFVYSDGVIYAIDTSKMQNLFSDSLKKQKEHFYDFIDFLPSPKVMFYPVCIIFNQSKVRRRTSFKLMI